MAFDFLSLLFPMTSSQRAHSIPDLVEAVVVFNPSPGPVPLNSSERMIGGGEWARLTEADIDNVTEIAIQTGVLLVTSREAPAEDTPVSFAASPSDSEKTAAKKASNQQKQPKE